MGKLISVIVPVYNVKIYLRRCIESILSQTYEKIEIILIDDGSTDGSELICEKYARKDSRVHVIHKKNEGLSSARNTGVEYAKGDYIAFVDGDDYIEKCYIEKLHLALVNNRADIAICGIEIVDENGKKTKRLSNSERFKEQMPFGNENYTGREIILNSYTRQNGFFYIVAWNKLYRRELFEKLRYPKGLMHEDEYVFVKLFLMSRKVTCICEKLYNYIQRKGSIISSMQADKSLSVMNKIHQERKRLFELHDEGDLSLAEDIQFANCIIKNYCMLSDKMKCKYKRKYNTLALMIIKNKGVKSRNRIKFLIGMVNINRLSQLRRKIK